MSASISLALRVPFVRRSHAGVAAAVLAALGLCGCVSVFPKSEPMQLYRFGQDQGAASTTEAALVKRGPEGRSGVVLSQVILPHAAMGDGILTVTGDQAAYIAGSRWLSPAVLIFDEDVMRSFEGRAQRTRILDRGQLGVADALLRLDVGRFETSYDNGPAAAPTVVINVRATITGADGRQAVQRIFIHREPAAENRVGAIVAAYDKVVDETLAEVVDWTDATAPSLGPAASGPSKPTQPRTSE